MSGEKDYLMKAEELLALAERVEEAEGPDRELDREIKAAVGDAWDYAADWGPRDNCHPVANAYTASLDAVMTLVPEGWRLRQMNFSGPCADDRKWHLNLHGGREGGDTFVGRGRTPALALCAAALRARASGDHP